MATATLDRPRSALPVRVEGRQAVVPLAGEIDLGAVPRLRDALHELRGRGLARVVVDVRDVSFIDSAGVLTLVAVRRLLAGQGTELVLRAPSQAVVRLLALSGLRRTFSVEAPGEGPGGG